ncbi:anti-virulence regulator CigR family protein [Halomonas sp.]|uniref:anti-virulence regulator CigR family protein n=1 Tax=Halomonas sp. TaxID=1486246 RepID=UPI003D11CF0F
MRKRFDLRTTLALSGLALLMATGPALAQPPEHAGQGKGQAQRPLPPGQQKQERRESRERYQEEHRDRESWRERRDDGYRDRPIIDERDLRRLFGERRDWVREEERAGLPPGIRMNLERGKPLPPGIAKRFDDRVLRDLPHYDGYEWRRVGPDAILVDAANEIIYRVIRDVLY